MDHDVVGLIRAIGILQGLVLGVILIIYSKKNKSSLFLGLFLLGFAIEFLPGLISDMRLLDFNPRRLLFLLNLSWILFPLLLLYVARISILPRESVRYRLLYPGMAGVLIQLAVGLDREVSNWLLVNTFVYEAFYIAGLIYSFYVLYRINQHLQQHRQEVGNQYAHSENKRLAWIRYFAFFCFALVATRITALFMDRFPLLHLIMACLNIVIITVIAISGIYQYNVINVLSSNSGSNDETTGSAGVTPIAEDRAMDILNRMDALIEEDQMYQQQDLTVADLARVMKVHPRTISLALNGYYQKNFNTYINQFRIRQAESLLQKGYTQDKSIEGLSQEVGFRSKASFYKAFKQNTGITPVDYLKKHVS